MRHLYGCRALACYVDVTDMHVQKRECMLGFVTGSSKNTITSLSANTSASPGPSIFVDPLVANLTAAQPSGIASNVYQDVRDSRRGTPARTSVPGI